MVKLVAITGLHAMDMTLLVMGELQLLQHFLMQ